MYTDKNKRKTNRTKKGTRIKKIGNTLFILKVDKWLCCSHFKSYTKEETQWNSKHIKVGGKRMYKSESKMNVGIVTRGGEKQS